MEDLGKQDHHWHDITLVDSRSDGEDHLMLLRIPSFRL